MCDVKLDANTLFRAIALGECTTVNDSLFGVARGDDTLSQLLAASSLGLGNDLTLDSALASNFGQYQINWRQEEVDKPNSKFDSDDVNWATNVKTARDAYFTALGDAATNFDGTLTGAIDTYYNTMLEAQITRSGSHFDASHDRYDALEGAMFDYEQAVFNAAKEASLAYLDAAIEKAIDDAFDEKEIYKAEKIHYDGLVAQHDGALDGAFAAKPLPVETHSNLLLMIDPIEFAGWVADLTTAALAATSANTTAQGQKLARESAVTNAITAAETTNANIRKATDAQTEKQYINAESAAWNTYYAAALAADMSYFTAYSQIEATFKSAKHDADETYDTTVLPEWLSYSQQLHEYESLYLAAIAHAGDAGFNVADWFNNGVIGNQGDYQLVAYNQPPGRPGQSQQIPEMVPIRQQVDPGPQRIVAPTNPTGDYIRADGSLGHINPETDWRIIDSLKNTNPYTDSSNAFMQLPETFNRPLSSVVDAETDKPQSLPDNSPPPFTSPGDILRNLPHIAGRQFFYEGSRLSEAMKTHPAIQYHIAGLIKDISVLPIKDFEHISTPRLSPTCNP